MKIEKKNQRGRIGGAEMNQNRKTPDVFIGNETEKKNLYVKLQGKGSIGRNTKTDAGMDGKNDISIERRIWNAALDCLFPRRCPVCDDIVMPRGALACPDCEASLYIIREPVCMKCGKQLDAPEEELCRSCQKRTFSFEYGVCLYFYDAAVAASMARIKNKGRREYLDFYARQSARFAGERIARMHADALVPVPVHASRLRARGYNQAAVLAEKLGAELNIPVFSDALCRKKKTEALKTMGPGERLKSLCNAFYAGNLPPDLESVCLIDDIFTTGATMEACTRALKKAGVKRVYCFSVCTGG